MAAEFTPREAKDKSPSFRYSSSPYMQAPSTNLPIPSAPPFNPSQSTSSTQSSNGSASGAVLWLSDLPPLPVSAPANFAMRNSGPNSGKESPATSYKGRTESPPLRIRMGERIPSGQKGRESSSTESGRGGQMRESETKDSSYRYGSRTSSLVSSLVSTPPASSPVISSPNNFNQFAFRPSTPNSILDRPRPITPDVISRSSPSRSEEATNVTPRSLDLGRPLNSSHSSARSIPRYANPPSIVVPPITDEPSEPRLNLSAGSSNSNLSAPGFSSVLDRGRSKTPDSASYFDAPSRPSTSHSTYSARSITPASSFAHQPRPSLTTSVSSHSSMSYESAASGGALASASGGTLLSLDLGIDESNVFDLDSFLSVGVSPVKKEQRPIPARLDLSGAGATATDQMDVLRWRETVSTGRTFEEGEEDESKTPSATTFPDDIRDLTPLQNSRSIPIPSTSTQAFVFPSPVGTPDSDASFEPLPLEPRPIATSPTRSSRHNSYSNASPHRHSTSSSTTSHYYDPVSADPSPVKRSLDADKSLPPTPSSTARLVPLGPYVPYDPPPASTSATTKPSVIRRGISKMMSSQGSISSTRSSSSEGHQSGFQVLSATSTKRPPVAPRARDVSNSSTKSNSSSNDPPSISAAGKRFADRFAASDRSSQSSLNADREETPLPPKIPRRKSTLSGLLSGSESLGMSLLGARKSETLLKKEQGGLEDSAMAAEGRRSFELHITKPTSAPRRASTDNLLVSRLS